MKTFIVDLGRLSPEVNKELLGFVLTVGLNFRKIDRKLTAEKVLFIEAETRAEEKALKEFLSKNDIHGIMTIGNANKVDLNGESVGVFSSVKETISDDYYFDNATGKKFAIVRS